MPGTPAASPNFGAPRFSDADTASFSSQVNAVTDAFDAAAAKRGAIVNADIASGAEISPSKLADPSVVAQPGDLVVSAAATRTGCLKCDGSNYTQAEYPALYAAIGTAYGATGGAGTFNVPDYRGRTIVGAGAGSGLTSRALGTHGGEESHVLSVPEMPAHSHPIPYGNTVVSGGTWSPYEFSDATPPAGYLQNPTGSTGGGGAHNNMQPYAVANVFIKS